MYCDAQEIGLDIKNVQGTWFFDFLQPLKKGKAACNLAEAT